ncbi:Uu.00g050620.m01.CDS01 [Anthostomella pinea]|uniref:Uu.00g050620.m01.CDS01 n=1 Tax=Anthostomella pinea TaxID=933095 RepID=A0AAI8VTB8_9PEZI|nr:Uu.00g050620.m01.CDS01 [Anthostomella pinea]
MAPRSRPEAHLSPPVVGTSQRGSPSDRSDRSDRSADSSERSYTNSLRSTDSRPARKRASKPKVRTGCINCKRRHVKCDEGEPSCAQCERLGIPCEGYAPPKVKRSMVRSERPLLPKLASSSQPPTRTHTRSLQPASSNTSILPMPSFGFELVDEDGWYFALFRDQVAHELSPYSPSNFWSQTSLRDSMVNKCIHHSILSIGAYARAVVELKEEYPWNPNMSRPWWPPSVLNRHHQAALVHHAKALSFLRSDIEMYGIDGRTTMAATLLFIVFENMQGNYHSSGNLIRSGIKVLTNIRGTSSGPESTLRHQRNRYLVTAPDEVDEMADMFARHSISSAYMPFAHGKCAYHLLFTEDDEFDGDDDDEDDDLPEPFAFNVPQNWEEARRNWDYLLPLLANFHTRSAWHHMNPDYDFDEAAARRQQAMYLAQLQDFGEALDSQALHFSSTSTNTCDWGRETEIETTRQCQGLELLRLHHLLAVVFISCCLDATEVAYDDFLPQFDDAIDRSRRIINARLSSSSSSSSSTSSTGGGRCSSSSRPATTTTTTGFTNEVGLLLLLAFVGAKCRARRVRAEALDLISRVDWREGAWDGTSLGSALAGLVRLEGQGQGQQIHHADVVDCRQQEAARQLGIMDVNVVDVPPEARFTLTNMFWDFDKRCMSVEYTKCLPNDGTGEFERVSCVMAA